MKPKQSRFRGCFWYVLTVLLTLAGMYGATFALDFWHWTPDPISAVIWHKEHQREMSKRALRNLGRVLDNPYRFPQPPPDDAPYASDAENLYHHIVVTLGERPGYPLPQAAVPEGRSRPVFIDRFGNPIHYQAPRPGTDVRKALVWSAGPDRNEGTPDDLTNWQKAGRDHLSRPDA